MGCHNPHLGRMASKGEAPTSTRHAYAQYP